MGVAVTDIDELREMTVKQNSESEDMVISIAAYMLGFGSYRGSNQ